MWELSGTHFGSMTRPAEAIVKDGSLSDEVGYLREELVGEAVLSTDVKDSSENLVCWNRYNRLLPRRYKVHMTNTSHVLSR